MTSCASNAISFDHLSALHRSECKRLGPRVALRFKQNGLYRDLSWSAYRQQADRAAAGLIELGIEPGDRVALLSENRAEWLIADHAMLSCGAVGVPLHAPLAPKQVEYQVAHSDSRGIIVSNAEQAAKVFAVADSLPELEFLVSFDPIAPGGSRLHCLTWQGLQHRGMLAGTSGLEAVLRREAGLDGETLATIIYTSGTTGLPKGVMLTHDNLLSNAEATRQISGIGPEDTLLSWLPYSHIYARTVDHYLTTIAAVTVALAESGETLLVNLAETQPQWLTAVPRFYEKVWNAVEHLPAAERAKALHRMFGPNMRQLCSGGAPLPQHVCTGFFEAGLPLLEGYGLTESSPVISFNSMEENRVGTVGKPIPGVEVRIANDGEILSRGPHVMKGYWKDADATAETIVDGWLLTGDVGELDADGFLAITDRKKDLFVTSAGKNVVPGELERLLTADPFIDQAVVYGDGRQFVSALLVPDMSKLESLAEELAASIETADGFIVDPAILDYYDRRVRDVMQAVSGPERVKRFLLLAEPFQLEADELTATLKVRRRHIVAKYQDRLAALYSAAEDDRGYD